MKCNICKNETTFLFKGIVLNKYKVIYYKCPSCDFIQTEKPYWLDDAYNNVITDLDVGLVARNLKYSVEIEKVIIKNFNYDGKFLDYAGGYGLFVRLMRDKGFNFYRQDKYAENIFARNFDLDNIGENVRFEAVTAFEVFEHLENPLEDIEKMLSYSDSLIFSTELQPKNEIKNVDDWWYFTPQTGQHISFYAEKTLKYIADKYHLFFYSNRPLHLLSKKKYKKNPLTIEKSNEDKNRVEIMSLTQPDYELAKKVIEKTIANKKEFYSHPKSIGADKIDYKNKLLDRLSLVYVQLDLKEKDLVSTKTELNTVKNQLETARTELESTKSQLSSATSELSGVYISRSWRVTKFLQKVAKVFFPNGSIRRKIAGTLFRVLKKAARVPRKLKNKIVDMLFRLEIIFIKSKPKKKRKINRNSKKIAYIGHSYHLKTQSTAFLINYLKKFYDVELIADENWQGKGDEYPNLSHIDNSYLAVIFFQNLPGPEVVNNIKNENLIFFPMYDATSTWDYTVWRKYRKLRIANFSSTLHKKLLRWGFESMAVQYFPKPLEFVKGKKNTVFFWQRLTFMNINVITKLFGTEKVRIHLHRTVDPPAQQFIQPSPEDEKKFGITYSDWFETREEMLGTIKQKEIYVAPREYEGIGLSFLEPMAMGKAVVAVNNPTMNEYIKDGETGYLFDLSNPKEINLSNMDKVQRKTYKYMCDGYKRWEKDKHLIIDFIEGN